MQISGECFICEKRGKLVRDHCHVTGNRRKRICQSCNTKISRIDHKVITCRTEHYNCFCFNELVYIVMHGCVCSSRDEHKELSLFEAIKVVSGMCDKIYMQNDELFLKREIVAVIKNMDIKPITNEELDKQTREYIQIGLMSDYEYENFKRSC